MGETLEHGQEAGVVVPGRRHDGISSIGGTRVPGAEVPHGGEYTGIRSSASDLPHFSSELTSLVGRRMAASIKSGRWKTALSEILDEMDGYGAAG